MMEPEKSAYLTQPAYYPPADGQAPPGQPSNPYPPPYAVGYYPQQYPTGYAQPPYQYPGAPPPTAPPQQQQQSVVMVGQPQAVIVQPYIPAMNFTGHIIFSCIVFWCCGGLFGLIAFILAMVGQGQAHSDPSGARTLANASLGMSIAGVIFGIILIIGLIVGIKIAVSNAIREDTASNTYCAYHHVAGRCYEFRKYGSCDSIYFSSYYSYDGYCYYNY